jgi:hypothetical protein
MRMRTGIIATALIVLLAPSLSVAAEPAIVYQTQPLGRLLDELRAMILSMGGPETVADFNKEMKRSLGDKGFDGFDLNRPIVGFIDIPADPMDAVAVIAFPITGEKEWLDFCERWNKNKLAAPKDGLYEVPPPSPDLKAAMRIVDGYAYIAAGMKNPARALDPKTLTPFAKLFDGGDVSLMSGRVHADRLPKELRSKAKEGLERLKKSLPNPLGAPERALFEPFYAFAMRSLRLSEGAKEASLKVNLDSASGQVAAELSVVPIPGSELDKVIGGMKPTMNRFAGIIGPDAAAGIKLRLPLDIPEVQNAAVAGLEAIQKEANNNAFPPIKGSVDELLKGLIRTVKTGEVDAATVLRGPAKDGTFTALAGIAFDDPSALEKELKKTIDAITPQEFKDALKWDAEKANGVSIHTIDVSKLPGGGGKMLAIFGQTATVAFAFAPKAVYATIGPGDEPVKAIKGAMAVKPVEAPMMDFAYNADKIVKLMALVEPQAAMMAEKMLGKQDKLASSWALSVTGGKDLKLKLTLNVKLIGGWFGRVSAPPAPGPMELRK